MNSQEKGSTKKESYRKPELVVYGDIRELTKSSNAGAGNDGATRGNSKTA